MAWYDKPPEVIAQAITADSIGRALMLATTIATVGTFVPLVLMNDITFNLPPTVTHGAWFVGVWFLLLCIVTVAAMLSQVRENKIKLQQADVAKREVDIKDREAAVATREKAILDREKDDLLTTFRGRLVGIWEMTSMFWDYDPTGCLIERSSVSHARITVDEKTGKLKITMDLKAFRQWKEDEETVTAIIIWPVMEPKYLAYYHQFGLSLDTGEQIFGASFTILDIRYEEEEPVLLSGTWYDLDQSFSRINADYATRAGIKLQRELPPRGKIAFKKLGGGSPQPHAVGKAISSALVSSGAR